MTSQIRRSSASIAANIAEGCGRGGAAELGRYLRISLGGRELEYHLLLARDLKILPIAAHELLDQRVTEVKRILSSLIQKLTAES
jgi:four helix bundle protein